MIERKESFAPFRNEELPISLTVTTAREYRLETIRLSEAEAVEEGLAELRRLTDEALQDATLLKRTVSAGFADGYYRIRCELYVETDIARVQPVPLVGDSEKGQTD